MFYSDNIFNDLQIDALREIGNIGAGNAATAFAKLLNKKIKMDVPEVNILPFNEIINEIGGADVVVAGVYLRVTGQMRGNILFLLSQMEAFKLIDILLGKPYGFTQRLDSMGESILLEIGNILSGAYLSSLADFTGLTINSSVPALAMDMAGAVLSIPLAQLGYMGDTALLIETQLIEGEYSVKGHFFLIPDTNSFDPLFDALGVKINGNS
ncbi:MAG: chemotaxis protein CheC [Thermosediminibacterales bacterium]|nr:chemotaxis protein CheC [Thermosediminibacterales bacterium]